MSETLPEGWGFTTLGDLSTYVTSGSRDWSQFYSDHGALFIRTQDINQNRLASADEIARVALPKQAEGKRTLVTQGDLLITITGANVGKCAHVDIPLPEAYVSQSVALVRLAKGFSGRFVQRQLISPGSDDEHTPLQQSAYGVGRPVLNLDNVRDAPIVLAPFSEQERIVAKIDKLLSEVDSARYHLSRVPAILKRFRQAVLAAACSGRLTADWREGRPEIESASLELERYEERACEHKTRRGVPDDVECPDDLSTLEIPDAWALRSVASLLRVGILQDVKDGNHGSNHPKSAELSDHGLPFITAAQVKNYKIDYDGAPKVNGQPLKRLKVGFAENGDVILTHKGTVGRVALNTRPCVLTPQTTYYRSDSQLLNPAYLVYLFTSPFFYSQLAAVMSQTTRDFVPISEQYRLFLLLPPVEEQKEISRRVDALFGVADKVEQALQRAIARIDRLSPSILAKAFRGELVPTEAELARREGREYEPASVLLERIKKERSVDAK